MHFHQKILEILKKYRSERNNNFNFLVRQRARIDDKNFPGGKFAHGIVFQGNDYYCSVGLIDKGAGNNSTRSVSLSFSPLEVGFSAILYITFKKEKNEKLLEFYNTLASKFQDIEWNDEKTEAHLYFCEFTEDNPSILYNWLDKNYSKIRNLALETGIEKLLPSDKKYYKLQERLEKKLQEAEIPNESINENNNTTDRRDIFNTLKRKLENAGFKFEAEQETHGQNRKETEYKFTHTELIKKFEEEGLSTRATKFYIKPLTDEQNCEIGFVTGRTSPLISEQIFSEPNSNDTHNDCPAWTNRDNDYAIDRLLNSINNYLLNESMKYPLNQILFGPPGTGKTYSILEKALKITDSDIIHKFTSRNDMQQQYRKRLITDYGNRYGRISFCSFHQSFTYEDFIEGIKPEISDDTDDLKYLIEDGVFKRMCNLAFFEALKHSGKLKTSDQLNFDEAYENLIEELSELESKESEKYFFETKTGGKIEFAGVSDRGNILVSHVGGERIYTVSKNRLRKLFKAFPDLGSVSNIHKEFRTEIGGSNATSYYAVLKKIKQSISSSNFKDSDDKKYTYDDKAAIVQTSEPINTKNAPPFVLIIDEINRGNVASIFGELITLIESDKRADAENELSVVLPYSKTKFSVPSNLYIIATMNTADRSIEALDSALRRRFVFEEMLPQYDLIDNELNDQQYKGFKLSDILRTINERITILINRDHQIGHSYFLKLKGSTNLEQDMKNVFLNKIIPLLQEYFFNDYVKIAMVLGEGFMDKDKYSNVKFAKNVGDYESDYEGITTYEIKKDIILSEAIKQLMGVEVDES